MDQLILFEILNFFIITKDLHHIYNLALHEVVLMYLHIFSCYYGSNHKYVTISIFLILVFFFCIFQACTLLSSEKIYKLAKHFVVPDFKIQLKIIKTAVNCFKGFQKITSCPMNLPFFQHFLIIFLKNIATPNWHCKALIE